MVIRIPAQLVRLVGEQPERADEGLLHPREGLVEHLHDVVALDADDLAIEPVEEDGVPRLVLDLRGDVELLLLGRADHEDGQLDFHLPLAVVEPGCDADEGLPLVLGHLLGPVDAVLGEVQLVDVPSLLQVLLVQGDEVGQLPQAVMDVLDHVVDVDLRISLEISSLDVGDLVLGEAARPLVQHCRRRLEFGHRTPFQFPRTSCACPLSDGWDFLFFIAFVNF